MIRIAPSIMAADLLNLDRECQAVIDGGADWLHIDVMDGHFVPNLTFGPDMVAHLSNKFELPLDVHLMVDNPGRMIPKFIDAGADYITIHAEACVHIHRHLQTIKKAGVKAGIAINPGTPVDVLAHILPLLDMIVIMTVNPGFAGQSFIDLGQKIQSAGRIVQHSGREIDVSVDGGITLETAKIALSCGANVLVSGSGIFKSDENYGDTITRLKGIG